MPSAKPLTTTEFSSLTQEELTMVTIVEGEIYFTDDLMSCEFCEKGKLPELDTENRCEDCHDPSEEIWENEQTRS